MTEAPPAPHPRGTRRLAVAADVAADAQELIAGIVAAPWGQVSPSVYETGRLVTLAPWLTGHGRRIAFLLDAQRPDGGWGPPDDGYALVPTLSATEALLAVLGDGTVPAGAGLDGAAIAAAAGRGLRFLGRLLPGPLDLPDMPAIELISPALIIRLNRWLEAAREHPCAGSEGWPAGGLPLPAGMGDTKLTLVRELLLSGADVPQKLLHALEIAGDAACGLPRIRPESTGTIGASPAATAAWLGDRTPADPSNPARWHLETVSAQHGGPVPVGFPLTVFERAWVMSWLVRAGVPVTAPPELVLSLTAPLGPHGTPAADGLPADADTTSGALYALALLGAPHRPDPLWEYENDTHFSTWRGEDGSSITTNTHVLEAFGQYLAQAGEDLADPGSVRRYAATVAKVAGWLRGQQGPDGAWTDRWHASPYYATSCCAIALDRFDGERSADAVARARRWVLETQRPDGSWGRWQGTAEETAYAVQLLLLTGGGPDGKRDGQRDGQRDEEIVRAATRGRGILEGYLQRAGDARMDPPLWHDKDLYHPTAIVRAGVLAALHLIRTGWPNSLK
ncbi:prenyltransferase/squalene oxidase repeat-containing protein [Spirillospora sp. NPDC029432]|uniref:prenyltransferase/squalene oxidase repeat-containing protein n=1 Tax=Spirillospora sp. NPDC029432 TaxID=3154599 RepID=UPI0034542890